VRGHAHGTSVERLAEGANDQPARVGRSQPRR
jgi:hypothetical protein